VADDSIKDLIKGRVEGLRERKKRETRQQISDTATRMFLERGFDNVKVAEVAKECGVSEKTIYNYFPNKESLLLDREEEMAEALRDGLGVNATRSSPVDAAVDIITATLNELHGYWTTAPTYELGLGGARRFFAMVHDTPSLRAAQYDMMNRLIDVAATAMAERAGVSVTDPEPQMAATALLGLWRVQFHAIYRHADGSHTPDETRDLIAEDVRRAARLIDSGLWSFGVMMQGGNNRDQLKTSAEQAQRAAKQVVAALRRAHRAWRQMQSEEDVGKKWKGP
jgi:AcrR family transcriptional regulator